MQGFDGGFRRAVARDDDAGQVGGQLVDLPDHLESIDAGHLVVAEHEIDGVGGDERDGFAGVARGEDLMTHTCEDPLKRVSIVLLVVDDEDSRLTHVTGTPPA